MCVNIRALTLLLPYLGLSVRPAFMGGFSLLLFSTPTHTLLPSSFTFPLRDDTLSSSSSFYLPHNPSFLFPPPPFSSHSHSLSLPGWAGVSWVPPHPPSHPSHPSTPPPSGAAGAMWDSPQVMHSFTIQLYIVEVKVHYTPARVF